MRECIPGKQCPEIVSGRAWNRDRLMSMQTWMDLRSRIQGKVEEFNWKHCQAVAAELGLEYEQVHASPGPTLISLLLKKLHLSNT